MNVDFDLPLLKLKGIKYDDENFRYNGYRLETWNSNDLQKIGEHFQVAEDLFFQTEMSINKDLLSQLELDHDKITLELANLLFGNLEMATNLQKFTGVRFDEINIEFEGQGGSNRYTIDGEEYDVYYENELISDAKDFNRDYVTDMGLEELIGDIKYLSDYYDVIDPDKLWEVLEDYAQAEGLDLTEAPDDSKRAIQWFVEQIGDDGETVFEIIEDKELFDYDTYVDSNVQDVDYAIDVVNPYIGDLEYSGIVELDGWKPSTVYIFKRY
jgi:hypothetical protein